MSAAPSFAAIPVVGSGTPSASADATFTAPTHAVTLLGGQTARAVADGVTASNTTVTSATAAFNSGDIGRPISGGSIPAGATIIAVASATSVTISAPATASASAVALTLGGGTGTKVEEIDWVPNGSPPVLGVITIFLFDGTNYRLIDDFQVNATPTNSATVAPGTPTTTIGPERHRYANLWIPNGWSLVFSSTVASQLVTVTAYGLNQ